MPGPHQPHPLRAAVGRLPPRARGPVPGGGRRLLGRSGVGGHQRLSVGRRPRPAGDCRRQRRGEPGRRRGSEVPGSRGSEVERLCAPLPGDRLPHRRPVDDGARRGVLPHPRADGLVLGPVRPRGRRPDGPRTQPAAGRPRRAGAHSGRDRRARSPQGPGRRLRTGLLCRWGGHAAAAPGRNHSRVPGVSRPRCRALGVRSTKWPAGSPGASRRTLDSGASWQSPGTAALALAFSRLRGQWRRPASS